MISHIRIDFSRRDAGVSQQFLDKADVNASLQELRRRSMSQHMRCYSLGKIRVLGKNANNAPEILVSGRPAQAIE